MKVIKDISKNDAYYPQKDNLIGMRIMKDDLAPSTYRRGKWLAGGVTTISKVSVRKSPNNPERVLTNEFFFYAVKVEEK